MTNVNAGPELVQNLPKETVPEAFAYSWVYWELPEIVTTTMPNAAQFNAATGVPVLIVSPLQIEKLILEAVKNWEEVKNGSAAK